MNNVLLTTLFTGYNYGSSLQTLATITLVKNYGLECKVVARKSLIPSRDFRISKLLGLLWRSLINLDFKSIQAYRGSYRHSVIGDSTVRFTRFEEECLKPERLSWRELKMKAKDCCFCLAGSDQIWDTTTMYVDPLYYLRFATKSKRVAWGASLGHDYVPDFNKRTLTKWISEFAFLSVREVSGVKIIKELTGRDAMQLVDPSLLLDGDTWRSTFGISKEKRNYILAYFLDNPSEKARKALKELKEYYQCEVIGIPYIFEDNTYCDRTIPTGPIEFVDLISKARVVVTDSFHGTVFSINLHTSFYSFDRNYGKAVSQSGRLTSILKITGLSNRFEPIDVLKNVENIDFSTSDKVLKEERKKANDYLNNVIKSCC